VTSQLEWLVRREVTVGTTESIVDLDGLVMQAWKTDGIEATRRKVEARLIEERQARLGRYRLAGKKAYAWGYLRRKTLLTPVGDLGPIRIARLRVEGREERLIPRYRRRIRPLDLLTAEATIGGISQRRMSGWLFRANGERLSAATVGRIVLELGDKVEARRFTRLTASEYPAVAVDGIYGRYRGGGEAVLVVAMGVRSDGTFEVLDWQAGRSESADLLEGLLDRLYRRGLTSLKLLVGDGAGALQAAREMVYPGARFQLCLWHRGRTLRRHVGPLDQRRFMRDYWEVYDGLDLKEVLGRARRFRRRWAPKAPRAIEDFRARMAETTGYLQFPERWRHRVRTVNLAEGFFRNFRRFFNRFPGFRDPAHLSRTMGLYLLGVKPDSWIERRTRRVA